MRNRIKFEPRYDWSKTPGESYIDYLDERTNELFYTLKRVDEKTFDHYIKKYGDDLLISIEDAAFDECIINWYDMNNHHDVVKFKTSATGALIEIPMILFKIAMSPPAQASLYYVNTILIDRYKEV